MTGSGKELPAGISGVSELGIRYLPYSQLQEHGAAISRFGTGMKPLLAISQLL